MYRHHHYFIPTCVLFLFALQSYIVQGNNEPFTVTLYAPLAGLLGTTAQFSVSPSGGAGGYTYQWTIADVDQGITANQSYLVPNTPAEVTVKCKVTDKNGSSLTPQIKFWQVKITLDGPDKTTEGLDSSEFSIEVEPTSMSKSLEWQWRLPQGGGGNNPDVEFEDENNEATTVENAHWYAQPDNRLTAPVECFYGINCKVTVSGEELYAPNDKNWEVEVGHDHDINNNVVLGKTLFPKVTGEPAISYRDEGGLTIYYVSGIGTLTRMNFGCAVYPESTGQFHEKFQKHEQKHYHQFTEESPWKDKYAPLVLYNRVKDLTSTSLPVLTSSIGYEMNTYNEECRLFMVSTAFLYEPPAYAISNAEQPDYLENDSY